MLQTYREFIDLVNQWGFMPFYGKFLPGFPTLQSETLEGQWHTGQDESDPWRWKDRAAAEKALAFGSILGGFKGFVAPALYPHFYAACSPASSPEERYEQGQLSAAGWQVYRLFAAGEVLSTADVRQALGVSQKAGAGQVDAALKDLEKTYVLTVCGNKRKVSAAGQEYGWPANTYQLVRHWAPAAWLQAAGGIRPPEARAAILERGQAIAPGVDVAALGKVLFGQAG